MPFITEPILIPGATVQVTAFAYPASRNIKYYRGDNLSFRIQFSDENGARFNLNQVDSFLCKMKVAMESGTSFVDLEPKDFVLESSAGDQAMDVLHVLHKGGLQFRDIALEELFYDVKYRMASNTYTALKGICYIEKDTSSQSVEEFEPGPVSVLSVDTEATQASVTHSEDSLATFYQYRLDGGDTKSTGINNPFTITGLDPATEYSLQIRAGNDVGVSEWSEAFLFQTEGLLAPAGAPVITGTSTTETTAEITWSGTSGATGYEYSLDESPAVDIGTVNPFDITGLTPDTPHSIRLRGYNAAGAGPWSSAVNFTTQPEDLNPPENAPIIGDVNVTDTTAEVFYSGVSGATSYEYRLDGGSVVGVAADNPFTITGLTPEQAYSLELRGVNGDGAGPWSTPKEFTTNPVAPSETPVIDNIDEDLTTAAISYTGVARATSYEFEVTPVGGQAVLHEGTDNPFTVDGLTADTDYFIRMRGVNVSGAGPWSDSSLFTTGQLPQTAPSVEGIEGIPGTTGVRITRSDVDLAAGYHYRLNAGSAVDAGADNPFDITSGVSEGVTYNFEMRAYNQYGNGPWSEVAPLTVGEVSFSGITDSGFTAAWPEKVDPDFTHGQLTYRVYSSEDPNIKDIATTEANGTLEHTADGITSHEFTEQPDNRTLYINVIIENPDGVKRIYQMGEVTTEEDITIGSSVNISSISEDSDGVLIGYHELDEFGDGPGEGYEVEIMNQGNPADTQIVDISSNNPSSITGLLEGTTYTFQVRAFNTSGPGPFGGLEVYTTMVTGAWSETETWEVV